MVFVGLFGSASSLTHWEERGVFVRTLGCVYIIIRMFPGNGVGIWLLSIVCSSSLEATMNLKLAPVCSF